MSHPPLCIKDFEMMAALGSGSYSTVYKAKRKKSNELVAIKTVAKDSLSKSSIDALIQEIRILRSLKHKYIVQMLDFTYDAKNIYIIMEICEGGDLSAYIRQHKRLPESTCKFFLRQLAIALKYMRGHDISHFDLKPHNLLLSRNPSMTLKVADFGFAQHIGLEDYTTAIKGSPLYMAPEILLERRYDPSADLWSIGCILYECLFGWAPYRSKSLEELLQKVQAKQPIDMSGAAKLSAACEDLLARLLVHDPARRIAFGEFFEHTFLDMEHEPTSENLGKAIQLITQAIEMDHRQQYAEAYALYCEGLQFFVPLISAEPDASKKRQLRDNADSYLRRAEEIKNVGCGEPSARNEAATMQHSLYSRLYTMCASRRPIQDALQIGRKAELYQREHNLEAAVDTFRSALSLLVPLLGSEPKGVRKDMLHKQISDWMLEAERSKALLEMKQLSTFSDTPILPTGAEGPPSSAAISSLQSAYNNCSIQ